MTQTVAATPSANTASKPAAEPAPRGWPVLRLGFRPFYLGAALFACLAVPWWIMLFLGRVQMQVEIPALLWHAHEMLFGFAVGVIVGFLLTAVRAWTGHSTPRGWFLGLIFLLWLAARIAAVCAPYAVFATIDMLLLPVVAIALLKVLADAKNKRNPLFIGLLLVMALVNLIFHLAVTGVLDVNPMTALHAELGLIILVVTIMTGRVVAMFTRNGAQDKSIQKSPRLEWWVLGCTAVALACWVFAAPAAVTALISLAAAVLHAVRLCKWKPQVTFGYPILWILHLSIAFLPIGFVFLALAQYAIVPDTLATHAFGVGVIGGLIIGMMTRTARGHTARPLRASGGEILAYVLILLAAVLRVFVPAFAPQIYPQILMITAFMWSLAFIVYLLIYTPWLFSPRLDGKDG